MNTVPPTKIADFVMCYKRDGEIGRVRPREGDEEMAELFAHAFQWLRMEIKIDTRRSLPGIINAATVSPDGQRIIVSVGEKSRMYGF